MAETPTAPPPPAPDLTFTADARRRIRADMAVGAGDDGCGLSTELALRITVHRLSPGDLHYDLVLVGPDEREPGDTVVDAGDLQVFVDAESAPLLDGVTVGFEHSLQGLGFTFDNPHAGWRDPLARKVQEVLDEHVNPAVASHGGRIRLMAVEDGVARLEMGGGCQGCGLAETTLQEGVEKLLKKHLPEIREVVDVTDHAAGTNPYFAPDQGGPDQGGESPL